MEQFECEDGTKCIPKMKQCDGKNECDDKSDEKNCPVRSMCEENANCKSDCQFCSKDSADKTDRCGEKSIGNDCDNDDVCCTGFCFNSGEKKTGNCEERSKSI